MNPAMIIALQFDEDVYDMLRRAGVSESRIDAMRGRSREGGVTL